MLILIAGLLWSLKDVCGEFSGVRTRPSPSHVHTMVARKEVAWTAPFWASKHSKRLSPHKFSSAQPPPLFSNSAIRSGRIP